MSGGSHRRASRRSRRRSSSAALSASRRVARGGREPSAGEVRRAELLGAAGPRLRRPKSARADRRPRAGGPRRQPHRASLHRRSVRATSCSPALYRERVFANQPTSVARDDGLLLTDLYVAAVNRCAPPANKPTPDERDNCLPYLVARDARARANLRVIVCLGAYAWDGALRALAALGGSSAAAEVRPRRQRRWSRTCCSARTTRASRTPSRAS